MAPKNIFYDDTYNNYQMGQGINKEHMRADISNLERSSAYDRNSNL